MTEPREQILDAHRETIGRVIDCGQRVAGAIEEWPVTDPQLIRQPLQGLLEQEQLPVELLALLDSGARALGESVQGQPVPHPPYLVVTSRGPICRGTLTSGRRLVLELLLFAVDQRPRRYRFRSPTPETCLAVTCQ